MAEYKKTAFLKEGRSGNRMGDYCLEKLDLSTPHSGQVQLEGRSSKAVPGAMPLSGSPTAGSYTYPHMSQTYFSML